MRLFRRRAAVPAIEYEDDDSMAVRVVAADPARADSEVLVEAATAGLDLTGRLLVRHHLTLPGPSEVERAAELLAQDGYRISVAEPGPPVVVRAWRTQQLTALSAAQERSRMAGLAQRLGGDVHGWDACAPSAGPDPAGR